MSEMVTKEELEKLVSLVKQREDQIDSLYKLGIDVIESKLVDCMYKVEDMLISHFWDEYDQDVFWEYVCSFSEKKFTKEEPFMWDKDDNPLIWDDESFIDYMIKSQKQG